MKILRWLLVMTLLGLPWRAQAETSVISSPLDLTQSWAGYFSLVIIVLVYVGAMIEDLTFLKKSKPMLFGASLIWLAILIVYREHGDTSLAVQAFRDNLMAYMELLLFIMVSMTYLNVMEDMRLFDALRLRLLGLNLGYRPLFWITGLLVFLMSTVVNGLTSGRVRFKVMRCRNKRVMPLAVRGPANRHPIRRWRG